ncbi:MAG: glycosyltransferase family 2 protein, partial [Aristaeellaceae bacterium]
RVFNQDGTEQFLPKKQPTIRYLLGGRLERLGEPFRSLRRDFTLQNQTITQPTPVGFATGCFLLIRTDVFRQLKGFDERFFLYQEDSDLSRRAMEIGQIIYHPDMCVTHVWARENTRTLRGNLRQVASIIKFFRKWGWAW